MKTPESEIRKARKYMEDYKSRTVFDEQSRDIF